MGDKSYLEAKRKERDYGMKKHGSLATERDGAHRLSHRVTAGVLSHAPGRGGHGTGSTTGNRAISGVLNQDVNIRIKTQFGNRTLDERRDARIVQAYAQNKALTERTTANRAVQAYKGGMAANAKANNRAVSQVTREIGEMTFNNGKPGRPMKIKNMAKK